MKHTENNTETQMAENLARSFGWDICARKNGFAVCSPNRPLMGDNVSETLRTREDVMLLVSLGYAPNKATRQA